jgi:hypothetical protein
LDYGVHPDIEVKPEAEDPAEGYETVDKEITERSPHTGRSFVMTGARFGTLCPICVARNLALSTSILL